MNERERADALARAIDDLINGPFKPEPEFQDEELRSLLRVAQARLQESTDHGRHAADHEAAVWRRLIARIEGPDGDAQDDPPLPDSEDLRDAVSARQQMSDEMLQMAEQYREEVWRRLQGRLGRTSPTKRRGIFPFRRAQPDVLQQDGPPASRTRLVPPGVSDVDSLIQMAVAHNALRDAGEHTLSGVQAQIRQRMRSDPGRRRAPIAAREPRVGPWPGVVAMGAVALMIIALAAPVTATSLVDSPAAQAFDWVKEHLGIHETREVPPSPGPSNPVAGVDVTIASASELTGLPLSAPDALLGLPRVSQRLFPLGMTSAGAGLFVAGYADASGASLTLYEEAAGGSDIAIPEGSATHTVVGDSGATYFEGGWSSEAGAMVWVPDGRQTLVFERDRVRYVLQYVGPRIKRDALIAAGDAVVAP